MMRAWSHRPPFLHLGLFMAAYVLAGGFAQSLAIVPGTGISIWPPGGLFMATLILAPRPSWPWWVLGGCLAELFSNVLWFHSPLPAALLIYAGNALEAAAGAWLVNRACGRPVRLETLREVLALVVLGAGIAPVISATVGSATLAWFGIQSQSFATAWPLWWIGDATGVLIVAPLALVVFQSWRGKARISAARWIEAGVLGLIFLAAAALSLSGYLPFAYIVMPPLLWAAVRFEFKGAVATLALLALVTAAFTVFGASQFAGDPESQRHKQVMLQLFLAISALSALIVAAISRQHHMAVLTLRQSVEALRHRERELSQLVDMVPSHVWRLTPDGEPTFFNKRMVDFTGLDVPDTDKPGMTRLAAMIEASVHPDDASAFGDALGRCLRTGEAFAMRYRLRRHDGVYRWMSSRAEPMRDLSRRILQWYGLCHDIDDQMHAEEALQARERELSLLVDMIPSHLWRVTPEGETSFLNKHMADYLGVDTTDRMRLEVVMATIFHPDDTVEMNEVFGRCLATGEVFSMKYRLRRHDGEYRWMSGRAEPLRDEDGRIVQWFGLCHDIDDQVRAEDALRRASGRLAQATQAASLAELSASIAHEVNQPLAAIVANSHACHRWLSAEPPNIERAKITAERITRDANSAADVISRIRALFRHAPQTRSSEDVNRLIGEVCTLMADEIAAKDIRIRTALAPDLPSVALDRVQVQQVIVNLIRNGIEAMDGVFDGERALQIRSRRDGPDTIRVEVRDAGPGFRDPERVFEPFFTTKQHGMGMGLAICRSIIESHRGRLWTADNEPCGATVIFTLPLVASEAA
ncbi:MASE1 domain-containing protein [Inquilinus limosus]|uniref:MASE1 domain-containing protein n=1 Tax=Inquilinus limosus TaxID=171674 RepID=UPI0004124389|nr:MASE1 domain-containing protein [Inquilinus limosus]